MLPGNKTMYMVMAITEKASLIIGADIKISWADGMVGAIPVFDTREAAEAYADNGEVVAISIK